MTPYYAGYLAAVASGSHLDRGTVRQRPTCPYRAREAGAFFAWMQGVLDACRNRQHEAV